MGLAVSHGRIAPAQTPAPVPVPVQPVPVTQPAAPRIAAPRPIAAPVQPAAPAAAARPAPAPAQAVPVAPAAAPTAAAPAAAPTAPVSAEEKPVRDAVAAFAQAYSKPDVQALTALFTDDADVVDSAGEETRGKVALAEMYVQSFQDTPGLKLESEVQEVRFLTPDVARANGRSRLTTGTGEASEYTRFSTLLIRRDGRWLVGEIREYPAPAEEISSYERLKELEWMVGDWVDESEAVKAAASIRWAENNSFLVRTHNVQVRDEPPSTGTVYIGWDPQSGQIKSWSFDSEGGHGEAFWTRSGENQWVVKAQGVLHDGRSSSATQIYTVQNKDSVKINSIDRIVGGELAPDVADILMIRRPPQPGTAASAAGAPPAAPATAPAPPSPPAAPATAPTR
jgi:uncharacterized protein (TIGR02246 family)